MQPNLYGGQVTHAYERWLAQIPSVYAHSVIQKTEQSQLTVTTDPCCLAVLKHYRSLMPMAQTARKPIFKLTAADGAIGAHSQAVRTIGEEFQLLGKRILSRVGL
jgi:chromosome partitioning protein